MPYKNPEDKKAHRRRWYYKNREKILIKAKVYRITKRRYPRPQACSICGDLNGQPHHPDYSKPLDVIWLCKKHHDQVHYKPRLCTVEDCGQKHWGRGMCQKHYYRLYYRQKHKTLVI